MKRSEVNQAIRFSMETLDKIQFRLPDFAYWGINEWKERKGEWENVKDVMQGWDVTDFGSGDFAHVGFCRHSGAFAAYVAEGERTSAVGYADCEISVVVGGADSLVGRDDDAGTYDRFAFFVNYRSFTCKHACGCEHDCLCQP